MKTIKKCLIFILALGLNSLSAQTYGEVGYPHGGPSGSRASCGIKIASIPTAQGMLFASYRSNSPNVFAIDRLWSGLTFGGFPAEFQKEYSIAAGISSCGSPQAAVSSCYGVSVSEGSMVVSGTQITTTFAVTGAFNEGCFFTILSGISPNYGVPIPGSTFEFLFPVTPTVITKPLICESITNPGQFFIAGSYDNTMYVVSLDATGTVFFSQLYSISGEPRAIMESPYTGDLALVGLTTINGFEDGFFMELNTANGSVNNMVVYDNGAKEEFSCFAVAQSTFGLSNGFVIGGRNSTADPAWILKIDPVGTVIWSSYVMPTSDNTAGNIVGVLERVNTAGFTQYFATLSSSVGIMVLKFYDNGQNWNTFSPVDNDEFAYNSFGGIAVPVGISDNNNGIMSNVGIQVYGSDDIATPTMNYGVQAYYDGESGCNASTIMSTPNQNVPTLSTPAVGASPGLSICSNIFITASNVNGMNPYCGPTTFIPGASNARGSATFLVAQSEKDAVRLYPNPVAEGFYLSNGERKGVLSLYNGFGQWIAQLHPLEHSNNPNETYYSLSELGLPEGLYYIGIRTNSIETKHKIIVIK